MENNTYAMPHNIASSGRYNPYNEMQWYLQQSHRRYVHQLDVAGIGSEWVLLYE